MTRRFTFKFILSFLCLFFFNNHLFSFIQDKNGSITVENYQSKVIDIFNNFKETEDTSDIEGLRKFLKKNNELKLTDTIKSYVLYLNGVYEAITLHRYKEANKILKESYKLAVKTENKLLQGYIFNDRAVLINYIYKNYERSDSLYRKAIDCFENVNNKSKLIEIYYNLTVNSRELQNYKKALEYAETCLELIGDNEELLIYYKRIYYLIADSYIKLNNFKRAEYYINILEKKLQKSNYKNKERTYAWYYEAKANLNVSKGENKLAFDNLKKAILSWRKLSSFNIKSIQKSYKRELDLEQKLRIENKKTIKNQKKILVVGLIAILLLFLVIFLLILFFKKNSAKNNQIKELNKELNSLILDLKNNNIKLNKKNREIEDLLKLNEKRLFSRVLKISTYNDAIRKISLDIDEYMNKNSSASSYVMKVRNKLELLISEDELWEDFKFQFEKIRPDFFDKVKRLASDLSVNDLKHCTYIVSNLKSKEVAQLINISPRSVDTTRYRIKKKIGLKKNESLYDLLSSL